ncbi:hypothetical protein DFH11DRAFT_1546461 [Phellopilus nigrolimitatus]|nr:hypothetical protein DFH11DRAFT_1546461 [Phellopilus nigrolimitatus]
MYTIRRATSFKKLSDNQLSCGLLEPRLALTVPSDDVAYQTFPRRIASVHRAGKRREAQGTDSYAGPADGDSEPTGGLITVKPVGRQRREKGRWKERKRPYAEELALGIGNVTMGAAKVNLLRHKFVDPATDYIGPRTQRAPPNGLNVASAAFTASANPSGVQIRACLQSANTKAMREIGQRRGSGLLLPPSVLICSALAPYADATALEEDSGAALGSALAS